MSLKQKALAYQKDERAVNESHRSKEDVEGLSECLVLPSVNHYESDHAQLDEQQNGPHPGLKSPPDAPVVPIGRGAHLVSERFATNKA